MWGVPDSGGVLEDWADIGFVGLLFDRKGTSSEVSLEEGPGAVGLLGYVIEVRFPA